MKKTVVGHMDPKKESPRTLLSRWQILPWVICLLLSLLIWLGVTQTTEHPEDVANLEISVGEDV